MASGITTVSKAFVVILAATGLLAYRRALGRWLAGPAGGEFTEAVADEFELLEGLFADG